MIYVGLISIVALSLIVYFVRVICRNRKIKALTPLEDNLAIVLAKIHNTVKAKSSTEMVKKGVGTKPKIINGWVADVWEMHVGDIDEDDMSGKEFEFFVKKTFKLCKSKYYVENKDVYWLVKNRFKLKHGRITKEEFYKFLFNL